jgi:hypothetical protein
MILQTFGLEKKTKLLTRPLLTVRLVVYFMEIATEDP